MYVRELMNHDEVIYIYVGVVGMRVTDVTSCVLEEMGRGIDSKGVLGCCWVFVLLSHRGRSARREILLDDVRSLSSVHIWMVGGGGFVGFGSRVIQRRALPYDYDREDVDGHALSIRPVLPPNGAYGRSTNRASHNFSAVTLVTIDKLCFYYAPLELRLLQLPRMLLSDTKHDLLADWSSVGLVLRLLFVDFVGITRLFDDLEVTAAKLVLLVQKLLLLVLKVNAAGINVTTVERLQLLKG
ncbi:hypothetical protein Tco_0328890 [Tanacetum coccineum]